MAFVSPNKLKTALLIVDIQEAFRVPGYFGPSRNNECFPTAVSDLVESSRRYNATPNRKVIEVVHILHHSTSSSSPLLPGFRIPENLLSAEEKSASSVIYGVDPVWKPIEGEEVFVKNVNSAFIGTSLREYLQAKQIRQLLICGLTTEHCVSTTVRMAANLKVVDDPKTGEVGKIFLVQNACQAFSKGEISAEMVHKVHVESLRDEFATIIDSSDFVKVLDAEG